MKLNDILKELIKREEELIKKHNDFYLDDFEQHELTRLKKIIKGIDWI